MTDKIVVLSTCGSEEEATRIARRVLEQRLAACVSLIPQIRSFCWWHDKIENSTEYLLLIKTTRPLFEKVRVLLESSHSYELPEVLALPVIEGSPNYLNWIENETAGGTRIV